MFASKIIAWYTTNKRSLPWREINNTYFIWLSEIILQQTRVAQGLPYYNRFIEAFPNIDALAGADEQDVLQVWQGLGYYSRARNLHKCAKKVVEEYEGVFPASYEELLKLPGIGPYTAAAIASLGYNLSLPVVDGNVYRVLSRVFGLTNNIADTKSFKVFFEYSGQLIDKRNPGEYNQAIMELGATVCLPQNPLCSTCPVEQMCYAKANDKQTELPVKLKKIKKRERYFTYLVFEVDGRLALRKRTNEDIWKGLFEFYKIEGDAFFSLDSVPDHQLVKILSAMTITDEEIKLPKHLLSHQTIYSSFIKINLQPTSAFLRWMQQNGLALYSQEEIEKLPKPVLISKYLNSVTKSIHLQ